MALAKMKLEDLICHRFYVASNAMVRLYRPHLEALNITYPQYLVLIALWEQGELEVGDIKEKTRIDGGALSLILKKLEIKKLITIKKSQQDRRIKQVCLTDSGQHLEKQAVEIPKKLACQFPNVSAEDLQNLVMTIDKVLDSIVD